MSAATTAGPGPKLIGLLALTIFALGWVLGAAMYAGGAI
jgi:hypothetical protein